MKKKTSQEEIDELTNKLIKKIKKSGIDYGYIVGIARGGLHISKNISKELKIEHRTIKISFYGDCITPYPKIIDVTEIIHIDTTKPILFTDDLIDNGYSINWIESNLKEYYKYDTAVLYWNKRNRMKITPTYFAKLKPEEWLVFPWDDE